MSLLSKILNHKLNRFQSIDFIIYNITKGCHGVMAIEDDYKLEIPSNKVNCSWIIEKKAGKVLCLIYVTNNISIKYIYSEIL